MATLPVRHQQIVLEYDLFHHQAFMYAYEYHHHPTVIAIMIMTALLLFI